MQEPADETTPRSEHEAGSSAEQSLARSLNPELARGERRPTPWDLSFKDSADKEIKLSAYRDKVILLIVWDGSNFIPEQTRGLQYMHENLADDGLIVLGACNQNHENVAKTMQENGADFPYLLGNYNEIQSWWRDNLERLGENAREMVSLRLPKYAVIDRNGTVTFSANGPLEESTVVELSRAIERARATLPEDTPQG